MAKYKRYFPVSHEINRDPEVWEITDQYGDRSLRFILEIFSLIDRHENRLPITDKLMATLSRMLRQSLAKCWLILGQMLAKHWLIADETSADGRPTIVSARNYADYHRKRSEIREKLETKSEQIGRPPKLPNLPTSLKEKILYKKENDLPKKQIPKKEHPVPFPADFTLTPLLRSKAEAYWAKKGKAFDVEHVWQCFEAHHRGKGTVWVSWPHAWQTWYSNAIDKNPSMLNGNKPSLCPTRIFVEGQNRYRDCGKMGTHKFNAKMLCWDHYQEAMTKS